MIGSFSRAPPTLLLVAEKFLRRRQRKGSRARRRRRRGEGEAAAAYGVHGGPQGGAAGGSGGVDDGADVWGVGHEERPGAGLLYGLLQDPRDAQAEQARALPSKPRRRRGPPRAAAEGAAGAGPVCQVQLRPHRRRPTPAAPC